MVTFAVILVCLFLFLFVRFTHTADSGNKERKVEHEYPGKISFNSSSKLLKIYSSDTEDRMITHSNGEINLFTSLDIGKKWIKKHSLKHDPEVKDISKTDRSLYFCSNNNVYQINDSSLSLTDVQGTSLDATKDLVVVLSLSCIDIYSEISTCDKWVEKIVPNQCPPFLKKMFTIQGFFTCLSLSGDGSVLAVGDNNSLKVYKRSQPFSWSLTAEVQTPPVSKCKLSRNGQKVVFSDLFGNVVVLYEKMLDEWEEIDRFTGNVFCAVSDCSTLFIQSKGKLISVNVMERGSTPSSSVDVKEVRSISNLPVNVDNVQCTDDGAILGFSGDNTISILTTSSM